MISNNVSADNDSVVDEINITVPVSCTIGGTGMDTHNATINNGQYNSAIGESTIKAFCNDSNGFSIYAIGYTDDTDGNNVLANATLGDTYDIATGILTTGADSQWAMKLSTITSPVPTYPTIIAGSTADTDKEQGDPDFTSFQEVPDDYTKVAYRKAGTDINPTGQSTAEGSTIKSTYQVYISQTQPAGTYTGQVKYTMVHPYNTAAPEKPVVCNPTGTTVGTNTDTDIVCMQDVTSTNKSTILASMTEDQQYTLRDKRDSKTYTVSKLKDGNIWMTQNLDLDLDSTKTYTNEDTDIGWNTSTNSYNAASWIPLRSTYDSATKIWCQGGYVQYNSCSSNSTPESYDPGDLYWNGALVNEQGTWTAYINSCSRDSITLEPISCNESLNPIATYTTASGTPNPEYHFGNYYNWTAAVAMNDSSTYNTQYQDVNQSICPTGWTLPKSGNNTSNGSFQYLFEQYGWSNNKMANPYVWDSAIKIPIVGHWDGLLTFIGEYSSYWSPIIYYDTIYAYKASAFFNAYVGDSNGDRTYGYSVRCLTR